MSDSTWERWVMQTASTWEDIAPIIKETGISYVDHDHKRLTEYALELNELLIKMEGSFNLDLVKEQEALLDRFVEYTSEHFEREEIFLRKYKLPGLERQMEEHKSIISMLKRILFDFKTGRISSAYKLRLQILNWVIKHINTTDNEVFNFLNICDAILEIDSWADISGFIRNVHIPPIDHDHKILTQAIMEVGRGIRQYRDDAENQSLAPIREALEYARTQTKRHFDREEKIIREFRIPGEKTQKDQHSKFLQYLEGQLELLKDDNDGKLDELERELLFWWIQHINIYDYKTFRKMDWFYRVFDAAEKAEDLYWLVSPTGIQGVDEDHKTYIRLLFEIESMVKGGSESAFTGEKAVEELLKVIHYARDHFHREEAVMKERESLNQERHMKEHRRILNQLEEHRRGMETGLVHLDSRLRELLLFWWIEHTNGMDYETFGAHYE